MRILIVALSLGLIVPGHTALVCAQSTGATLQTAAPSRVEPKPATHESSGSGGAQQPTKDVSMRGAEAHVGGNCTLRCWNYRTGIRDMTRKLLISSYTDDFVQNGNLSIQIKLRMPLLMADSLMLSDTLGPEEAAAFRVASTRAVTLRNLGSHLATRSK